MTRRNDTVTLRQMLDHTREAVAYAKNRSRRDLDTDRLLALALAKLVEIIGEAAGRLSPEIREAHPEIPWIEIIGTRNRLIHGYDAIDFDILWRIVSIELPDVAKKLEVILREQES